MLQANSPRRYNITTGRDNNGDGVLADRPNVVSGAYVDPGTGPGVQGNLGKNAGITEKYIALDARLAKSFAIKTVRLKLIGEAFNVTNRVNYATFQGNIRSALFSQPIGRAAAADLPGRSAVRLLGLVSRNATSRRAHRPAPGRRGFHGGGRGAAFGGGPRQTGARGPRQVPRARRQRGRLPQLTDRMGARLRPRQWDDGAEPSSRAPSSRRPPSASRWPPSPPCASSRRASSTSTAMSTSTSPPGS